MRKPTTELQTMATMLHIDRPFLSSCSMVGGTVVSWWSARGLLDTPAPQIIPEKKGNA